MVDDTDHKIIKQIEYYFGDYNLPRDKFLQKQITLDDGWVELSVLLTFKRLAALTTDPEIIVEALKKSTNNVVSLSEDGKKVRRCPDLPVPKLTEEREQEIMSRTVYAKGFPAEDSLDTITKFLCDHGEIEACTMRSFLDKATKEHKFKGSCFIVFKNLEEAKKFVGEETLKYQETELIRKWQRDYISEKKQQLQERRNDKKKKKETNPKVEEQSVTFPKGAVLFFSIMGDEKVALTWEAIKAKVTEVGKVEPSYIDFKKENVEGHVRLPKENDAVTFFSGLSDGVLEIGNVKLQFKVLEGEEEQSYLDKTVDILKNKRQTHKKGKKPHRASYKRKNHDDNDSSHPKKAKA